MSLRPEEIPPVPEETCRVAQAAFPRGNIYMRIVMNSAPSDDDQLFTSLFPARGQPAESPWRLALATVIQFAEGLSDRQAADAVRSRIDWKYALGLELTDPGFDHTVLSEFRTRLVAGQAELLLLDTLLRPSARTWPPQRARSPTHRLDACAGRHSRPQSAGARRRDAARRTQQPRGRGARLAADAGACGMV